MRNSAAASCRTTTSCINRYRLPQLPTTVLLPLLVCCSGEGARLILSAARESLAGRIDCRLDHGKPSRSLYTKLAVVSSVRPASTGYWIQETKWSFAIAKWRETIRRLKIRVSINDGSSLFRNSTKTMKQFAAVLSNGQYLKNFRLIPTCDGSVQKWQRMSEKFQDFEVHPMGNLQGRHSKQNGGLCWWQVESLTNELVTEKKSLVSSARSLDAGMGFLYGSNRKRSLGTDRQLTCYVNNGRPRKKRIIINPTKRQRGIIVNELEVGNCRVLSDRLNRHGKTSSRWSGCRTREREKEKFAGGVERSTRHNNMRDC